MTTSTLGISRPLYESCDSHVINIVRTYLLATSVATNILTFPDLKEPRDASLRFC